MFKELSLKEKKILLYFISFILGLLTTMLIGISDVFALTNKTIYSGINDSGLTGSGYYNYGYINEGGVQSSATGQVGTVISGVSYGFNFYLYEDISIDKTYTLKINFTSNDLKKEVNSSYIYIYTCNNDTCNNSIIVSLEKSNYTSNSNFLLVKFNPILTGNIIMVDMGYNNEPLTSVRNFGISSVEIESTNPNQDIIDSSNQNTDNIIDNNNSNTQEIIDSNKETQDVIKDQFNTCRDSVNLYDGVGDRCYAGSTNGIINCNNSNTYQYGFTHRVDVKPNTTYTVKFYGISSNIRIFYSTYDSNGNFISRNQATSSLGTFTFTTNSDTYFVFIWLYDTEYNFPTGGKIQLEEGSVATNFEEYGKEVCSNKIDETNDKLDNLQGSITDSNSTAATNSAGNFFSGFETDTFGLTSIITAPLDLIGSITSSTCSPLPLTLPFVNTSFSLPCMSTIYEDHFGDFLTIYQTITFGIVAYWVCVRIFALVKDFKNPDHDEIEVLDL